MAKSQITCHRCLNTVEVEKFSPEHTSVQWHRPTSEVCHELRAAKFGDLTDAFVHGCSALRLSIRTAEADGMFGDLAGSET